MIDVVRSSARRQIKIKRAIFSAVTKPDVQNAIDNMQNPDKKLSDAVLYRSELDLRIGASFT